MYGLVVLVNKIDAARGMPDTTDVWSFLGCFTLVA